MKFSTGFFLVAAQVIGVFSATVPEPSQKCGILGVMSVNAAELPKGVKPNDVRKCLDHPMGRDRDLKKASMAPVTPEFLALRNETEGEVKGSDLTVKPLACEKGAPYGCSKGYCWKTCGKNGEWCWTAYKGGLGSWIKCNSWKDCGTTTYACGRGGCPSCGCSC